MQEILSNILLGSFAVLFGFVMFLAPDGIYLILVNLLLVVLGCSALWMIVRFIKRRNILDVVSSLFSFVLFVILSNHQNIPLHVLQIIFGIYCLLNGAALLVQMVINALNNSKGKFFLFVFSLFYWILGIYLIRVDEDLKILIRAFGFYLMILGGRYVSDGLACVNPLTKYEWKRKVRITFPAFLCAFFPDWALNAINRYLEAEEPYEFEQKERNAKHDLSVFVHVGPVGFQKVGHICFAYNGIAYSYGNYDSDSFRLNQTLGDGVFFKVPVEYYIPNAMEAEQNTIFEYGIALNEPQRRLLEEQIQAFEKNSYRWHCKIEREDGYHRFDAYKEDYPSRLHYKTGAKLYKFKQGKFKTYWALGDNCALFTDRILGCLGADILSIRGIISPGTYLEWLQNEYLKKNSPIVSRTLYTLQTKKDFNV
ncbi:hypothetical protein [Faecalicoccus pleomorphus]|uniref:hypothetical protein n=1 Tax=Faecalicoccus pleomorphus TaxID=1323 RepID=UPI0022E7E147|nr:hypothetical protein [Faecalicoccus pleomorphus]